MLSMCIPNSYNFPTSYHVLQAFMHNSTVQRMMKKRTPLKRTQQTLDHSKKNYLNCTKQENQSKVPVRPYEKCKM